MLNTHFLQLDSKQSAISYIKFFCALFRAEGGPFHLVSDMQVIPFTKPYADDDLGKQLIPISHIDGDFSKDGFMRFQATVLYSNILYTAVFKLFISGVVDLEDNDPITSDLPILQRKYDGIFRSPLKELPNNKD